MLFNNFDEFEVYRLHLPISNALHISLVSAGDFSAKTGWFRYCFCRFSGRFWDVVKQTCFM
ncbi:MAG: hypothetical protein ACI9EW_002018 [Cellvibrionaceae bacterium]|jgi:hypothetical protein